MDRGRPARQPAVTDCSRWTAGVPPANLLLLTVHDGPLNLRLEFPLAELNVCHQLLRAARSSGRDARGPSKDARASMTLPSFRRNRVEEERIRRQRLATILRPKAEENNTAFAHGDFDECGFAFDPIAAQQPAGEQRVFVFRIPRDDVYVCYWDRGRLARMLLGNLKHRRVLSPVERFLRHSIGDGTRCVEFNAQNRTWYVIFGAGQTGYNITYW